MRLGPEEGRDVLKLRSTRGFTLIELLVTITIAGVLLTLGAPSLSTYLQNSKIGNATQTLYSALQQARTEAIRRNTTAEFLLTDAALDAADVAVTATAAATGKNWIVRAAVPAASAAARTLISAKSGMEGQGGSGINGVAITATEPSVVFDALGATVAGATPSFEITNAAGGACAKDGGPMRCKRIRVSAGGQVSVCDPAVTDTTDKRFCS
jgi:type IV fimbrial biogenesis protein FimT